MMTVKELIAELQKFDEDLEVWVLNDSGYWSLPSFVQQFDYKHMNEQIVRIFGTEEDED